jgi:hypothetical protein
MPPTFTAVSLPFYLVPVAMVKKQREPLSMLDNLNLWDKAALSHF